MAMANAVYCENNTKLVNTIKDKVFPVHARETYEGEIDL
jgi:hypothetical protein